MPLNLLNFTEREETYWNWYNIIVIYSRLSISAEIAYYSETGI